MDFLQNLVYTIKGIANMGKSRRALDNWFQATTVDDVYEQLLRTAIEPCPEMQSVPFDLLTPSEVSSFDATGSTFHQTPDGEIELSDVFHFLGQAHPSQAPLIQSAQPHLTALLHAHARFPFSKSVPLTQAALLRAVMLLTQRGTDFFTRHAISPPRRSASDRLTYIFKALATPDAGVGLVEYEDIVEVLTRLPFPLLSNPTRSLGKSRGDFMGMAERLDPPNSGGIDGPFRIPSDDLRTVAKLVAAFAGETTKGEVEDSLIPTAEMGLDQFLEWGTKMHLLKALDELFEVMLQPHRDLQVLAVDVNDSKVQ